MNEYELWLCRWAQAWQDISWRYFSFDPSFPGIKLRCCERCP